MMELAIERLGRDCRLTLPSPPYRRLSRIHPNPPRNRDIQIGRVKKEPHRRRITAVSKSDAA